LIWTTHRAVFTWVLQCLSMAGLVKGKAIGIGATTLEADAALRSIVRRESRILRDEAEWTSAGATSGPLPPRMQEMRCVWYPDASEVYST
jgi:hypothetical protein